jgi:hypothetical protein
VAGRLEMPASAWPLLVMPCVVVAFMLLG